MTDDREPLGRIVRETWVAWAREQYRPKPSWLLLWEELDNGQREVDMRIGAAVAVRAVADAKLRNERLEAQVFALGAHMPAILAALRAGAAGGLMPRQCRAALTALGDTGKVPGPGVGSVPDFIPGPETGPP